MSGGPKRSPDKLNTIGVVVVGICGAVLVYVTIVALQAFYMDDTSEIQTMADYGGQDTQARHIRQEQTGTLTAPSIPNPAPTKPPEIQTYRIPVKAAMKYVVDAAKVDPGILVPVHGRSDVATVIAQPGRPVLKPAPGQGSAPEPPPAGAGSNTAPTAPPAGAGSAEPKTEPKTEPKKTDKADKTDPKADPKAPKTEAKGPKTDPKTPKKEPKTPANAGSAAKGNAP